MGIFYDGSHDKDQDMHRPHIASAIARDVEFGYFDSRLGQLERAVADRRKTLLYAAVTGTRV